MAQTKIKKIGKQYIVYLNQMIGQGSFGKVYIGQHKQTKEKVAVKTIPKKQIQMDGYFMKAIKRQVDIMKSLSSPNIIRFIKIYESPNTCYILQQLAQGGTLQDLLKQYKRFDQKNTVQFIKHIVNGFGELAFNGIIHRDIKPSNFLSSKGLLKIADFGFSIHLKHQNYMISNVGTPIYMAPQILSSEIYEKYSYKCDIWSLGVVCYEMLVGSLPWKHLNMNKKKLFEQIKKFVEKGIPFPSEIQVSNQLKGFIKGCLEIEQENRFDWTSVFLHPIFQGFFKEKVSIDLDLLPGFVFSTIRMNIHLQNINLTKLLNDFPDQLDMETFLILIKILYPEIKDKEATSIFQKLTLSLVVPKKTLLQRFNLSGIRLKGRSVNEMIHPNCEKQERVKQSLMKLEDIIKNENIHLYSLFRKYNNEEKKPISQADFGNLLKDIDPTISQLAMKELFEEFDANNDGMISYEELESKFCKLNQELMVKNRKMMETLQELILKAKLIKIKNTV